MGGAKGIPTGTVPTVRSYRRYGYGRYAGLDSLDLREIDLSAVR